MPPRRSFTFTCHALVVCSTMAICASHVTTRSEYVETMPTCQTSRHSVTRTASAAAATASSPRTLWPRATCRPRSSASRTRTVAESTMAPSWATRDASGCAQDQPERRVDRRCVFPRGRDQDLRLDHVNQDQLHDQLTWTRARRPWPRRPKCRRPHKFEVRLIYFSLFSSSQEKAPRENITCTTLS